MAWDLHQYIEVGRLETVEEDNIRTTFDVRSEVFISTFKTSYRPSYSCYSGFQTASFRVKYVYMNRVHH